MNIFSCKGPLLFIVIISCSVLSSQGSTEITKDNCKDNRTFLSECSFDISFQPPLTEKLECLLTFSTKTNYSVQFSSYPFVLQRQIGQRCPQFHIEIKTKNDKPKRLFTTCGGTVNPVLKTFYNFTLGHILYDNKGLMDNSTTIKMQLRLETGKPCDVEIVRPTKTYDVKNYRFWIIILSAVGCLIIIGAVIGYCCHNKRKERNIPNTPSPEAVTPCVSEEGGNGKGKDVGDGGTSQDLLKKKESVED